MQLSPRLCRFAQQNEWTMCNLRFGRFSAYIINLPESCISLIKFYNLWCFQPVIHGYLPWLLLAKKARVTVFTTVGHLCITTSSYNHAEIAPKMIKMNDHVWERDEYDTDAFQWVREMAENEYSWSKKEVNAVDGNEPIRMVTLRLFDETWKIQDCETGGPQYYRSASARWSAVSTPQLLLLLARRIAKLLTSSNEFRKSNTIWYRIGWKSDIKVKRNQLQYTIYWIFNFRFIQPDFTNSVSVILLHWFNFPFSCFNYSLKIFLRYFMDAMLRHTR